MTKLTTTTTATRTTGEERLERGREESEGVGVCVWGGGEEVLQNEHVIHNNSV